MNRDDLVIGQRYDLRDIDRWGVYEGQHSGRLTTDDGMVFLGADRALRFRLEATATEPESLVLLDNGKDVLASAEAVLAAQAERERKKQAQEEARATAEQYIRDLGLDLVKGWPTNVNEVRLSPHVEYENWQDFEVVGVTLAQVAHLLKLQQRD